MSVSIETITKNQVKSIIEGMGYGSILVKPWDEFTELEIKKYISLVNEIAKSENNNDYFDIDVAVIDIEDDNSENGFRSRKVEDSFRIRMLQRGATPPKLSDDDLNIDNLIADCFIRKSNIKTEISFGLFKHVNKIAKARKIKTYEQDGCLYLDGREKSKSYYQQITDAYRSGQDSVSFDTELVNLPTIRVYASGLSKSIGKKISCSITNGKICVRFKEKTPIESFKEELNSLIETHSEKLTQGEIEEIMMDFFKEDLGIEEEEF